MTAKQEVWYYITLDGVVDDLVIFHTDERYTKDAEYAINILQEKRKHYPNITYKLKTEIRDVPEREFPKTSLSGDELEKIYSDVVDTGYADDLNFSDLLVEVANAVIRQHIIDTEKQNDRS